MSASLCLLLTLMLLCIACVIFNSTKRGKEWLNKRED